MWGFLLDSKAFRNIYTQRYTDLLYHYITYTYIFNMVTVYTNICFLCIKMLEVPGVLPCTSGASSAAISLQLTEVGMWSLREARLCVFASIVGPKAGKRFQLPTLAPSQLPPEAWNEFTARKTPENGWLEYDPFLLGWPIFSCEMLVLGRVYKRLMVLMCLNDFYAWWGARSASYIQFGDVINSWFLQSTRWYADAHSLLTEV